MAAVAEDDPTRRDLVKVDFLLDRKRPSEALVLVQQVVARDPHDMRALCYLSRAHNALDQHDEALAAAEAAAAVAPDNDWPHRLRSIALRGAGRNREAVSAAERAHGCDPRGMRTYLVLAAALRAAGDLPGGLIAARRAIELQPQSVEGYNLAGRCLLGQRRWAQAEATFREGLRIGANHALLHNLAIAVTQQERRDEAIAMFEQALKLNPRAQNTRTALIVVAGRRYQRRLSGTCVVLAALTAVSTGDAAWPIVLLAIAAGTELRRAYELRRLDAPTRDLVIRDARSKRRHPKRWKWLWLKSIEPWSWGPLKHLPVGAVLVLNVVAVAVAAAVHAAVAVVALGLLVPYNGARIYRIWRARTPRRSSWNPQDV